MNNKKQSARAKAVQLRSYCRPHSTEDRLETWQEVIYRSHYTHQKNLWQGAGGKPCEDELQELVRLGLSHQGLLAGRTLWLGGTEYGTDRSASNFNCSFKVARTVHDIVDIAWLLLNGCGVGFKPTVGTLHGFLKPIRDIHVVPSVQPPTYKGREANEEERFTDQDGIRTWVIRVGDSAAAWSKAIGKLINPPTEIIDRLILDFTECRGPGARLKGYGWICNGFAPLCFCMERIIEILNKRSGQLLDEIDILDLVNYIGTVLSSRRSAQICLLDSSNPSAAAFSMAKKDYFYCLDCGHHDTPGGVCKKCGSTNNHQHRRQSNNTLQFWHKPTLNELEGLIENAYSCGGDPGIENASGMQLKAPWAIASNPCVPGNTLILTRQGNLEISSCVDKEVEVWNGEGWAKVTPRVTGYDQPLLHITLDDGRTLTCTPSHRLPWDINTGNPATGDAGMIEARFLQAGDSLVSFPLPGEEDKNRIVKIQKIFSAGVADKVYCFTEPETHRGTFNNIVTGQCHEICLADASVCNLTSIALPLFYGDTAALERAAYLLARANYRQTCVSFNDGVLSHSWNQTNESLRLCGLSLTGVIQAPWLTPYRARMLRNAVIAGVYSMADELGLPRPKATTCIKPEGTRSKISGLYDLEICEGVHNAIGRYIFNWINFSKHDSIVNVMRDAGYNVIPNPSDNNNVLICFPVEYSGCPFTKVHKPDNSVVEVNMESAVSQLERYLWWNNHWADHMVSCTISYEKKEIKEVANWIHNNWDNGFIAVALQERIDATKNARDVGQPYLPQEVVEQDTFNRYRSSLKEPAWDKVKPEMELVDVEGCVGGVCPIR